MEIIKLKAHKVINPHINEYEEFEIDLEEIELGEIEEDKSLVRNITKTTKMLSELTDKNTIYYTKDIVRRPNFEVNGGIKYALERGARLKEAKVFNLCFRFLNSRFDGYNTTALMVRPRTSIEEWIILLPEDTKSTISVEKDIFHKQIEKLLLRGLLDSDFHNMVVEGYNLLTPNERCAQTLMHEYGHVLQWRMYDYLNIKGETEKEFIGKQYLWFLQSGYLENVSKRIPNFENLTPKQKVYYSKECLVEDYRINLNWKYFNDKIILPSKYAYRGDFANSKLMWEGLSIMEKMLKPAIEGQVSMRQLKRASSEKEVSLKVANHQLDLLENKQDWIPGTSNFSEKHILDDLESLGLNVKLEKDLYTTV